MGDLQTFVPHDHQVSNLTSGGDENIFMKLGVMNFCLYRRFLVTKEGRFAVGPISTMEGDKVVLLSGSPVPYIMQKEGKEREGTWTFIGTAYIHGIMDGETMTGTEGFEEMCIL